MEGVDTGEEGGAAGFGVGEVGISGSKCVGGHGGSDSGGVCGVKLCLFPRRAGAGSSFAGRLAGSDEWQQSGPGDTFAIPANSSFDIRVAQAYHYICRYA